jgi:hypothetical protein
MAVADLEGAHHQAVIIPFISYAMPVAPFLTKTVVYLETTLPRPGWSINRPLITIKQG